MANLIDHPICYAEPRRLTDMRAWHEHIPFAFYLMDILRPSLFVELSTYGGDSYCAFCQAVDELGLSTRCYAVGRRTGDGSEGANGSEVLEGLRRHHDLAYGSFSTLLQCFPDEALKPFAHGSIDLLHMDGHHTYEAVKHDFDCWLPKLSRRAVVLLHDITVRERGFGVWKLWQELQQAYPCFEFTHGNGLGVVGVGGALAPEILQLLSLGAEERQRTTGFFAALGERIALKEDIEALKAAPIGAQPAVGLHGDASKRIREQMDAGDIAGALQTLCRAVEAYPDDPAAHNDLGMLLFQAGRIGEASSCFRRAAELSPGSEIVLGNLACCSEQDGQSLDALRFWLACYRNDGSRLASWTRIRELALRISQSGNPAAARAADDLIRQELGKLAPLMQAQAAATPESRSDTGATAVFREDPAYQEWIRRHAFSEADRRVLIERLSALRAHPRIHFLVGVRSEDAARLAETIGDLAGQVYQLWQLTLLAPFARPAALSEELRIDWIEVHGDVNEAAAAAVRRGGADWVAAIKPGDRLEPHCLATVALHADRREEWHFIYCDEDRIAADGLRFDAQFKPDFNLDLLRSTPYVGHFGLVRRSTLEAIPGLPLFGAAANYGLCLNVLDRCGEAAIGHIAEMLFHRCAHSGESIPAAAEERAGARALRAHLQRRGLDAEVEQGYLPGAFRVTYRPAERPRVSIIIPTRDGLHLLRACVDSLLQKTAYSNYEVIIVDNNSEQSETMAYLESIPKTSGGRVRVLRYPHGFNYSAINNYAAREAAGEFLLLLNNDTQIIQAEWLERMLMHSLRPEVGVVGARLLYPNGHLQHAGVIVGMANIADHVHLGLPMKHPGYMGRAQVDQDFSAVTAACLLIRKSLFLDVGGFDEEKLAVLFNDVDLCLKVRERNLKIVWTPHAMVVHHGSVSQNSEKADQKKVERVRREQSVMVARWAERMADDPAFNRHLSLMNRYPAIEDRLDAPWDTKLHDRPRIMGCPADREGSGQYRAYAPLQALHRSGRAQCLLLPEQTEGRMPVAWEVARLAPDTILLQSALQSYQLQHLKDYQWVKGLFKVFDLDDLKTRVPTGSVHYRALPKDIGQRLEQALALCDRLVVTTEPLKDAYRRLIGDIVVVPNYLEGARWAELQAKRRDEGRPRVGWAGGISHGADLALLRQVMKELAGEVSFVLFGMCPKALRPYVHEFHPGVPFDEYPARLASMDLALALAPLEINAFNIAKSNLRLLEYGILGWPVVCTDIEPYRGAPVRRVNNRPRDWIEAIREHLYNPDAAAKAGAELRRWVRDHWMLEDRLDVWLAALAP